MFDEPHDESKDVVDQDDEDEPVPDIPVLNGQESDGTLERGSSDLDFTNEVKKAQDDNLLNVEVQINHRRRKESLGREPDNDLVGNLKDGVSDQSPTEKITFSDDVLQRALKSN